MIFPNCLISTSRTETMHSKKLKSSWVFLELYLLRNQRKKLKMPHRIVDFFFPPSCGVLAGGKGSGWRQCAPAMYHGNKNMKSAFVLWLFAFCLPARPAFLCGVVLFNSVPGSIVSFPNDQTAPHNTALCSRCCWCSLCLRKFFIFDMHAHHACFY
jgi:hypothetical protein